MTVINLDDQVVATAYDRKTRLCSYTYQHTDGSRYTVSVPLDDLRKLGTTPANRDVRRKFLATKIMNHIQTNPPDKVHGHPA
jgi:DNA topoisomerase IB